MDGLADRGPPPSLAEPRLRLLETLGLSGDAATLAACAASDFIATRAQLDGEWFRDFASSGGWRRRPTRAEIRTMLESAVAGAGRVDELLDPLRLARHRMMVGAVWRHVLGVAELDETTGCCTDLADVFIDVALERVHAWAVERYGEPVGETSGAPQRLVVLGLGKLGAGELNLSSDVDLQFAYRETGRTSSGRSNQQFFVQVAQGLVGALDTPTGQGFAFRVDTPPAPLRRQRSAGLLVRRPGVLLRRPGAGLGTLCAGQDAALRRGPSRPARNSSWRCSRSSIGATWTSAP